jgi:transcriptional regulator with XRE-family HTH domain
MLMNKELSTFSKNLKYYRKKKGLSQYDLADITGISQRMIAHYETNATQPSLDKVEIIADAMRIKVSDLIDDHDLTNDNKTSIDMPDFDTKSLKKLRDILSLPPNDRATVYRLVNTLLRKNQLEMREKIKEQEEIKK